MRISKCIIVLLAVLIVSMPAFSQGKRNIEQRVDDLKTALELNDEQVVQVTEIIKADRAESRKNKEEFKDNKDELRNVSKALREKTNAAISAVLNEVQKKKYKALQEEKRKNRKKQPKRERK